MPGSLRARLPWKVLRVISMLAESEMMIPAWPPEPFGVLGFQPLSRKVFPWRRASVAGVAVAGDLPGESGAAVVDEPAVTDVDDTVTQGVGPDRIPGVVVEGGVGRRHDPWRTRCRLRIGSCLPASRGASRCRRIRSWSARGRGWRR